MDAERQPGRRRRRRAPVASATVALVASVLAGSAGTSAVERRPLLVSVAISLKAPMEELARRFEARGSGARVVINTGASGALLVQIEREAPVDVFVSASSAEMDRLEAGGRVVPASRSVLAENRLRVVTPHGVAPPDRVDDLADERFDRIAVGNARTVPAGRYAREALEALSLSTALEPRLVPAENARQVLEYVARGEVAAGIVYETDVRSFPDRVTAGPTIPARSHSPIVYVAARLEGAANPDLARSFVEFLSSAEAGRILARHGFLAVHDGPSGR